jgi:hypothetical protein
LTGLLDALRTRVRRGLHVVALTTMATGASAQSVLLQIRPHPGDTLHMRLDQEMDIVGAGPRIRGEPQVTVTTTWCVLQRMVVERIDTSGADVLQMTDSVSIVSDGGRGPTSDPRQRATIQGTRLRIHVAPDGAITLLDSSDRVSAAVRELVANLPVTFPRKPVKVGHSWVRTMRLGSGPTYGGGSEIKLEFRLDSVSAGGDSAFVSVHGPLGKPRVDPGAGGATVTTQGSLAGTMLIDRERGWLTDWHAIIAVQYLIRPPRGSDAAPQRMRMTAMQWLRAVDRP